MSPLETKKFPLSAAKKKTEPMAKKCKISPRSRTKTDIVEVIGFSPTPLLRRYNLLILQALLQDMDRRLTP